MMSSLFIDGSILEGGGQLLRNAVAFSTLFSKPIIVRNVRHNRRPPGLKNQHLAGIKLAAEISNAHLNGAEVGSSDVEYIPGLIRVPGAYVADPGTAGSTTLLLQISLPCLMFSPSPVGRVSTLTLVGGTNATEAPQIDYTKHIFLPSLQRHFGLDCSVDIQKRGYYPRGGGRVACSVPAISGPLKAITLVERGNVHHIKGVIHVGGLPERMAHAMHSGARERLVAGGIDPKLVDIDVRRVADESVVGFGGGTVLWAETDRGCLIGGSAVSAKGTKPQDVGAKAAEALLKELKDGGCVDEYMQDQLIIFLALAQGKSTLRSGPLTLHTKTAIWVAEKLTGAKFLTEEHPNKQVTIFCEGVGYTASSAARLKD